MRVVCVYVWVCVYVCVYVCVPNGPDTTLFQSFQSKACTKSLDREPFLLAGYVRRLEGKNYATCDERRGISIRVFQLMYSFVAQREGTLFLFSVSHHHW